MTQTIIWTAPNEAFFNPPMTCRDAAHMMAGEARYPLPCLLSYVTIDSGMVCLYAADHERPNPLITWHNPNWGLPIPEDNGQVVDWN